MGVQAKLEQTFSRRLIVLCKEIGSKLKSCMFVQESWFYFSYQWAGAGGGGLPLHLRLLTVLPAGSRSGAVHWAAVQKAGDAGQLSTARSHLKHLTVSTIESVFS